MNKHKTRGFTLLEVMLALSLTSLVASSLFLLNWLMLSGSERQSAACEANHFARTALQWITRDIISSQPIAGGSTADCEQITLFLPVEGKQAEEICYFLNNNNLRRNNLALVQNISYLNFHSDVESGLITVTVESSVSNEACRLSAAVRPRIDSTH